MTLARLLASGRAKGCSGAACDTTRVARQQYRSRCFSTQPWQTSLYRKSAFL